MKTRLRNANQTPTPLGQWLNEDVAKTLRPLYVRWRGKVHPDEIHHVIARAANLQGCMEALDITQAYRSRARKGTGSPRLVRSKTQ